MRPLTRASSIASAYACVLLAGCATPGTPGKDPAVASVRVVCTASLQVDCFDAPSRLCGRAGYDLFELDGRRATAGDARYRILEARCRQ